MKIQHWAIIFIIIILPISIITRNVISKKNLLLRDETRYNNIVDNATYDAVSQIIEASELLGYGKNIPITQAIADASIDRFFTTLSVNFNLPAGRENSEAYFAQYIPAIIIVGYDGLYVYSYESTASGYDFVLKPKIPYSYEYQVPGTSKSIIINFTLDNYVKIYFPDDTFLTDVVGADGIVDTNGTHVLEGYIGEPLDVDQNGVDDLNDYLDPVLNILTALPTGGEQYTNNDDPFGISEFGSNTEKVKYIKNMMPMFTENLSYILKQWAKADSLNINSVVHGLDILYEDAAAQDYEYDAEGNVTQNASDFHLLRRENIINLITSVIREEFNEHNYYADTMGITYNFNIPDIGRDQWNNTIDDISVLAFFQGMPIGTDMYYNNYSLGGSRIVKSNYLYGETVYAGRVNALNKVDGHKVYHRYDCPLIMKDINGNIEYSDNENVYNNILYKIPTSSGSVDRYTTKIENIFVNTDDARIAGYHICSECM